MACLDGEAGNTILESGASYCRAKLLVGHIVCAEQITVGKEDSLSREGGDGRIREKSDSRTSLESLTVQKVSITAHEVDRDAASGKRAQRLAYVDHDRHMVGNAVAGLQHDTKD